MDASPYWYFVPYDSDPQRALDRLRQREFDAGRYNPVLPRMHFGDPAWVRKRPGARHKSIGEAVAEAGDQGTRSILDVHRVDAAPDVGVAAPLSEVALFELFDTTTPAHDAVEEHIAELLAEIERGFCVYLVVYAGREPKEIFFAGYSSS